MTKSPLACFTSEEKEEFLDRLFHHGSDPDKNKQRALECLASFVLIEKKLAKELLEFMRKTQDPMEEYRETGPEYENELQN